MDKKSTDSAKMTETYQRMASCLRVGHESDSHTKHSGIKGVIFLNGHCGAFKAVLPGILRWIAFFKSDDRWNFVD